MEGVLGMNGKQIDMSSLAVMLVTLVLFVAALFVKGLGKDLLLEAGVFLVSVKLVLMAYKNGVATKRTHEDLERILILLEERRSGKHEDGGRDA
jgi:hypothetical protein